MVVILSLLHTIMMHRTKKQGLSNRQQYPQGFILSKAKGLPTSSYAHHRERRFIVGVTSYLEDHAEVRDENQKAQMSITDRNDRQLLDTSVSKFKTSNQSTSSNVNNVTFNLNTSQGGDQSNHFFDSETPTQPPLAQQNLYGLSSATPAAHSQSS